MRKRHTDCDIIAGMEMYMLRELAAFSEAGTLSKAAEELNTSQPAVSRSMQKLEDELGVPLFDRSKNRISLNRFGLFAAERAKAIVVAHDKMAEDVRSLWLSQRSFSYGSIAPWPIYELDPIIAALYPGIRISAALEEKDEPLVQKLDSGEFRLIVIGKPLKEKKYFSVKFFTESLSAFLPKEHRLAKKKSIRFEELRGESILIHKKIGFWFPLCKEKIPEANFLEQERLSALREIVKAADLPSFVTDASYKDIPAMPGKVKIPIEDAEARATFYCVCLKRNAGELKALLSRIEEYQG